MKKNKELIIVILFIFVGQINLFCQIKQNTYEYLTLKQFLDKKIENDTNFVKEVYKNVKYPKIAKERQYEGRIEIMILSHVNKDYEIIVIDQPVLFNDLKHQITKGLKELEINQEKPFVMRFFIYFSLDEANYSKQQFEKSYLGLINDNTFSIITYRIPLIDIN